MRRPMNKNFTKDGLDIIQEILDINRTPNINELDITHCDGVFSIDYYFTNRHNERVGFKSVPISKDKYLLLMVNRTRV